MCAAGRLPDCHRTAVHRQEWLLRRSKASTLVARRSIRADFLGGCTRPPAAQQRMGSERFLQKRHGPAASLQRAVTHEHGPRDLGRAYARSFYRLKINWVRVIEISWKILARRTLLTDSSLST